MLNGYIYRCNGEIGHSNKWCYKENLWMDGRVNAHKHVSLGVTSRDSGAVEFGAGEANLR